MSKHHRDIGVIKWSKFCHSSIILDRVNEGLDFFEKTCYVKTEKGIVEYYTLVQKNNFGWHFCTNLMTVVNGKVYSANLNKPGAIREREIRHLATFFINQIYKQHNP